MASKKSRRRRKAVAWYHRTGSWVILLCLAASLLFGLVWLARREAPPAPIAPPAPTAVQPAPVATERLTALTEHFLQTLPVRDALVRRDLSQQPPRYTVDSEPPGAAALEELRMRLQRLSPRLSLTFSNDALLTIEDEGAVRVLVFFVPPLLPVSDEPLVAIIMDDLGRDLRAAEVLLSLDQPVTFSILPGQSHAREIARLAHAARRDVLLHVPMEPQGYPAVNPGENALFSTMTAEEVARGFEALLVEVPFAVGTNNHMGSRFTENRRGMAAVMEVLRSRGMFFIDSLTTARSVGAEIAEAYGVPVLQRDVFLDNVADVDKIAVELHRLVDRARRNGQAIGICHPYPETLRALQRELPEIAARGVRVVPVSRLIAARRFAGETAPR